MNDKLYFYTFCVDIGKYTQSELIKCLSILHFSLKKIKTDYRLIVFTNFKIEAHFENSEVRTYYDNQTVKIYPDQWRNLSFNKINIYKDLRNELDVDPVWVDLDTFIADDISYIKNVTNCFVEIGGNCDTPNLLFSNNKEITVPRKRYIQGNFWKLNIDLYHQLLDSLQDILKRNLIPRYDLQDLFAYHFYIKDMIETSDINILGLNFKEHTINGLAVWAEAGNTHATGEGLVNLHRKNNFLESTYYPGKRIHILSFTFDSLKRIWDSSEFNEIILGTDLVGRHHRPEKSASCS